MLAQTQLIPSLPVAEWTNSVVGWITETLEPITEPLDTLIEGAVGGLAYMLTAPPELVMIVLFAAIAYLLAGWRVALFTALGLVFIISLGLWGEAMLTLSLVLASAVTALVIGIPIGIIAAKSKRVETVLMPVLDTMQTMPAFVYLVPVALVFSLGETPADRMPPPACRPRHPRLCPRPCVRAPRSAVSRHAGSGSSRSTRSSRRSRWC